MQLEQSAIQNIQNFFVGKPIKKAFLFGSYARNEANEDSDVDILVELDYSTHIGLSFFKIKHDLEKALGRKVDLVSSGALSANIISFVDRDKLLIYERKNQ